MNDDIRPDDDKADIGRGLPRYVPAKKAAPGQAARLSWPGPSLSDLRKNDESEGRQPSLVKVRPYGQDQAPLYPSDYRYQFARILHDEARGYGPSFAKPDHLPFMDRVSLLEAGNAMMAERIPEGADDKELVRNSEFQTIKANMVRIAALLFLSDPADLEWIDYLEMVCSERPVDLLDMVLERT